jgi:hypothetical protein
MRDPESVDAEIDSLWVNVNQLAGRTRQLEKIHDVWDTPWWRLVVFVVDGWPLRRVVKQPQWRPWRRWWTS